MTNRAYDLGRKVTLVIVAYRRLSCFNIGGILRIAVAFSAQFVVICVVTVRAGLHRRQIPVFGTSTGFDPAMTSDALDSLLDDVQRVRKYQRRLRAFVLARREHSRGGNEQRYYGKER
jgi:hypothetical protein